MEKETKVIGNVLVPRHLLHHKKSIVVISHMYMLLWADPLIESYLSNLHGAKQLQTDQLFNEGKGIGGGGPGLMGLDGERNKVQSGWAWLLMLNLAGGAHGRYCRVGTAGLALCLPRAARLEAEATGYACIHCQLGSSGMTGRGRVSQPEVDPSWDSKSSHFPHQVVATSACFGPVDFCGP